MTDEAGMTRRRQAELIAVLENLLDEFGAVLRDKNAEALIILGRDQPEALSDLHGLITLRVHELAVACGITADELLEAPVRPLPAVVATLAAKEATMTTDLLAFAQGRRWGTILCDPPWQFENRTGKVTPEHKRLSRYESMPLAEIMALPVADIAAEPAHLYLWVPKALLPDGFVVMSAWGFDFKTFITWHKIRADGGSDGRGVGFYFRSVTEPVLFGVRGKNALTRAAGRRQVDYIATRKRQHSRKPDELYPVIEACSFTPFLELFARGRREGWDAWGAQADVPYTTPPLPPPRKPLAPLPLFGKLP
jgi:N6-adenosine-specific RNA methylase IME4